MKHTGIHDDPAPRPAIPPRPDALPASRSLDTWYCDESDGVAVRVDGR